MPPDTAREEAMSHEKCGAVLDRGRGERPRRVTCVSPKGHDGRHLATWGGSQKWRQQEWSDATEPVDQDRTTERFRALTEAWQAVDRAVRPLGTECGQSRWNAGYTQARDEALNAILALRDA